MGCCRRMRSCFVKPPPSWRCLPRGVDERGLAINALGVDDFRLNVDGVSTKIDNLWSETDLPLVLGVITEKWSL